MKQENKTNVLILTNKIMTYRIPIFNQLASLYNLTIGYSMGNFSQKNTPFKTIQLPFFKFKRLVIQKQFIYKLASQYDVIIYTGDIAWLQYSTLAFFNRKFKVIVWSIGVSASYDKPYNSITRWDNLRDFFYKKADAVLLYSDHPIPKYIARGYDKNKLFVAHNTVAVKRTIMPQEKDSILFIGTLYKQKGILELIDAYIKAHSQNPNIINLNIIGKGEEYNNIEQLIKKHGLENKVHLLGAIYDEEMKEAYFQKAYACISPSQAGLGVLESMAHGIPFITKYNAITGGESFNIQNEINGILFNSNQELVKIILRISEDPEYFMKLGKNALEYYNTYRTPDIMIQGFTDAIKYVLKNKTHRT